MRNAIRPGATFRTNSLMVAALLIAGACSAPVGPIPGGALVGDSAEWPGSWTFTDDVDNVLLETRPADPYSVTIWGVALDGDFYVASGSADNAWARHIAEDNRVVLGVEGNLYPAIATRVTGAARLDAVLQAYVSKYEIDPEESLTEEGIVYALTPR